MVVVAEWACRGQHARLHLEEEAETRQPGEARFRKVRPVDVLVVCCGVQGELLASG